MGSSGRIKKADGEAYKDTKNSEYYDFKDNIYLYGAGNGEEATKWWKEHTEYSNTEEWIKSMTDEELKAVKSWTGGGYDSWAKRLYKTPWDDLSESDKARAINLYNALNKFELKKGIQVNRMTDFKIFGSNKRMTADEVMKFIKNNTDNGLLQVDGFVAFSTKSKGVSVAGSGLIIHMQVPPNKGGGAYVSAPAWNDHEKEYLVNNNSIMKFDPNSVYKDDSGRVHVNAKLVGRAKMQTIDPKNDTQFAKKSKKK